MSIPPPLVLVADDEPSMLELVARHLRTMKDPAIEVIEASDGEQAWSLAQEHLPDLVVLDVMMPGMSGWEVCRKIREDVSLAHTGVLMLTGIGENLNQLTSPLYGADAYIDKPFDFGELDEKVRTALEAREAQREGVSRPRLNGVVGVARPAQEAKRNGKAAGKKAKSVTKKGKSTVAKTKSGAAAKAAKGGKAAKAAKKAAPKKAAKVVKGAPVAKGKEAKASAKKGGAKAAPKASAKKGGARAAAKKTVAKASAKKGAAKKGAPKNGASARNGVAAKAASKAPKGKAPASRKAGKARATR